MPAPPACWGLLQSFSRLLSQEISQHTFTVQVVLPVSHLRKLRLREVEGFTWGQRAQLWWGPRSLLRALSSPPWQAPEAGAREEIGRAHV